MVLCEKAITRLLVLFPIVNPVCRLPPPRLFSLHSVARSLGLFADTRARLSRFISRPRTLTPVFFLTPGQHCVLLLHHLSPWFHYPRMRRLPWTKGPFSWVTVSFGRPVIGYLLPLWPRELGPNRGWGWPCSAYPPVAVVNHWQWVTYACESLMRWYRAGL